jgi:hypothetical protein
VVGVPADFPWAPPFAIIQTGPATFTTTIEPHSLRVATSVTRYVKPTGANANTGLSWAQAERSIWEALNRVGASATTIYVLGSADPLNPTIYDDDHNWISALTANVNMIVVSDETTLAPGYAMSSTGMRAGGARLGTWALTASGDGPNVYEATLAAANTPYAVIDASTLTNGAPTKLTSRASIALVQANPGSYYHDTTGNVLYVRTSDSRAPDASLRPLRSAFNGRCTIAVDFYVEGMTFEGGSGRAFYAQNVGTGTFYRCKFTCASTQGFELSVAGTVTDTTHTVYLIDCEARGNGGDGIGYTILGSGETVNALEWNCSHVGNSGAGTDQGGSAHRLTTNTGVHVIRVGSTCSMNKTQGFADVGQSTDGCHVWMLGGSITGEATGYYAGNGTQVWLHGCVLTNNTTDLVTDNAAGVINVSGTHYATTSGTGTVQVYHP